MRGKEIRTLAPGPANELPMALRSAAGSAPTRAIRLIPVKPVRGEKKRVQTFIRLPARHRQDSLCCRQIIGFLDYSSENLS
jgi:hypothetical protein